MQKKAHIFISYSCRDGLPYAEKLEQSLQEKGFTTWRDVRGINPSQDFTAEIEQAIDGASHIVVCLTDDTKRENSYVRLEIQYALIPDSSDGLSKSVIPIRFEDVKPHLPIINYEWINIFEDWDQHFNRLVDILNNQSSQEFHSKLASDDPFSDYLQNIYKSVVSDIQRTVFNYINTYGVLGTYVKV